MNLHSFYSILKEYEYAFWQERKLKNLLDEKRIRIMTRLALSEEKHGKENLKITKYYKSDYIRYSLLNTIISVTIGYVLILGMIALYHAEYLIANAVELDYKAIGMYALGIYLVLLVLYSGITIVIAAAKYSRASRFEKKYGNVLGVLHKAYEEDEEPKQEGLGK